MFWNKRKAQDAPSRKISLTARDKLNIAANIQGAGFKMNGDILLEEEVAKASNFAQKVLDNDRGVRDSGRKKFGDDPYLEGLRGLPEREVIDKIVNEAPYDDKNADDLADRLNEMGLTSLKAKPRRNEAGQIDWSWNKSVDRYEAGQNPNGAPVFTRHYNDGSLDQLDKRTYDEEKYYNFLPRSVKDKVLKRIN